MMLKQRRINVGATPWATSSTSYQHQCDVMGKTSMRRDVKQSRINVNVPSWETTSYKRQCDVMTSHRR